MYRGLLFQLIGYGQSFAENFTMYLCIGLFCVCFALADSALVSASNATHLDRRLPSPHFLHHP